MLFKTVPQDKIKHTHILYIQPDGQAVTAKTEKHTHPVVFTPFAPEDAEFLADPETGQIPIEVLLSQYTIQMANGHTHKAGFIPTKEEKELKDDVKKEDQVLTSRELYRKALLYEDWSLQQANFCEKMYMGDLDAHWEDTDIAKLKREKRACLVINETKPKIDLLSGHQRQNRTDIQVLPVEGGDSLAADMYSIVTKLIWTKNNADYAESEIFWDQLKVGRGNWEISIDTSKNIRGDIRLKRSLWHRTIYGPHDEPDASDADYAVSTRWMSKAKLEATWPDKAKEVQNDYFFRQHAHQHGLVRDNMFMRIEDRYINDSSQNGSTGAYTEPFDTIDPDFVDIANKSYRLLTVQRKVYRNKIIIFNAMDDVFVDVTNFVEKSDIENILTIENFKKVTVSDFHIQKVVTAGTVILENNILPFSLFTLIPAYGNKIGKRWWGKVYEVRDPQKLVDKFESQSVDIINKMASYGIGYAEGAFQDPKDESHFKRNRNNPGFIQKFAPGFKDKIHEFQGTRVPVEILTLKENASNKINTIMNINPEILGFNQGNDSGIAIAQRQRASLVGNEIYFDNLSLAKRTIGRRIIEAIQLTMSPDDILRIVENQNLANPVELGGTALFPDAEIPAEIMQEVQQAVETEVISQEKAQEILQNAQQIVQQQADEQKRAALLEILGTPDALQFDVVIAESSANPTTQVAQFAMTSELAKQGVPIPPDELILMTPGLQANTKRRITDKMAAAAAAQAEAESAKNQTEIVKTQIAADSKKQTQGVGVPSN